MVKERDDLVYLAKLAEQAERFDEMVSARPGVGVGGGGRRARRPDGAPDGPDGARSWRARSSTAGAGASRAGPEPAPAEPEPAPAEPEPEPPRAATMRAKKTGRGRTREKSKQEPSKCV
jgi:hypothetical protein